MTDQLGKVNAPDLAAIASTIHRLAVLLAAGVAPHAAWAYLPETGVSLAVVAQCERGANVPDAVSAAAAHESADAREAWSALAIAWAVATEAGAPLAPTLRDCASSLRDLAQAQREIAIALAGPTATARLVLALPLVGILFGMALGFNTIGILVTTAPGWICLGLGSALLLGAFAWNRRLVSRAQPRDLAPGIGFDLLAIAVSGGASLDRALETVARSTERYGMPAVLDDPGIADVLDLSRRAGVPAADLLRSEATERRRDAGARAQSAAHTLGVRLMIPLGVCVLPAFMVLSVMPLVLAVLRQTSVLG